ncbi:MAG: Ig-like domain-containing protein [Saprospiraceae bacterium]|nr:Ig-like domain-containing protein [Saprospiraceae bacterium]
MIKRIFATTRLILFSLGVIMLSTHCERDLADLQPVEFPNNPDVFRDGFSAGLQYAAFGGSVPTAFDVDRNVTYNNSAASMRFEVPDVNDPRGAYAGGAFFTDVGRNLTGYNALTFWAKASQPAEIDILGFGNDFGQSKYLVSVSGLKVNTNWTKYILPIPDPSLLTAERGMFFYSEGPENGRGYTFWIDEVKFEYLGTLAHPAASLFDGQNQNISAENEEVINITGMNFSINLPTGVNQKVNISPYYFRFVSSNPAVASVSETGVIRVLSAGSTTISATLGGNPAAGVVNLTSIGQGIRPPAPAPAPTRPAQDVISMFSNVYTNVPVDTWNTRWQFSTAEESFIKIQNDDVIRYRNLNFVGIEFVSSKINASEMTHFHLNIWTPDPTDPPRSFKVLLVDFGADGAFGGGDDSSHELSFTRPILTTGNWISLNIPLSSFTGLTSRRNLAQLVLSGDLRNVFVDNVYFYKDTSIPTSPATAAPNPSVPPANVISVFSDAYTNIPGTNLNPNWGQATVVSQVAIQGNNTLKYTGLNYQGIQFGSNQNLTGMGFLHLDFWTANSTLLNVYIISPGPVETAFKLTVPTSGWSSIDIPLSAFAPVNLSNVFQMKFDGNGDIFLDNIYFRK